MTINGRLPFPVWRQTPEHEDKRLHSLCLLRVFYDPTKVAIASTMANDMISVVSDFKSGTAAG
jgi:hypothetical protein